MITLIVILGETEDEAWGKADAALTAFFDLKARRAAAADAKGPSNFDVHSHNRNRQLLTAEAGMRQDRCLWMGMTKAAEGKFGNQTTLVGTPKQVTEALMDYYQIGVSRFLIRGYHPRQDVPEFGQSLFPMLRERVARHDAANR